MRNSTQELEDKVEALETLVCELTKLLLEQSPQLRGKLFEKLEEYAEVQDEMDRPGAAGKIERLVGELKS